MLDVQARPAGALASNLAPVDDPVRRAPIGESVGLSVIVPAFDEAPRIAATLADLHASLAAELGGGFEIVVVDDGSGDDTLEAAWDAADALPRCTVVSYADNGGKGVALRRGLASARGDRVAFFDADGDILASELVTLLRRLAGEPGLSAVVGRRRWSNPRPWYRSIASHALASFARAAFGLPVRETQAGAKVFVRSDVLRVLPACRERGFLFDLEVMAWMQRRGFSMTSVDIESSTMRRSRIGLANGVRELVPVLRIWWALRRPAMARSGASKARAPRTLPASSYGNDGSP